jgi:hypothetical protein
MLIDRVLIPFGDLRTPFLKHNHDTLIASCAKGVSPDITIELYHIGRDPGAELFQIFITSLGIGGYGLHI